MGEKQIRVVRRITYEGTEDAMKLQLEGHGVCPGSLKPGRYPWLTTITVEEVSREEIPDEQSS